MRELARTPLLRTLLLGLISFGLVFASLGIERTAYSKGEARHLGFGYPVHFAFSDFTTDYSSPAYPQTFRLNPWEIPVEGNPFGFLVSWVLVYGVVLACWLLARNGVVRLRRRVRGPT